MNDETMNNIEQAEQTAKPEHKKRVNKAEQIASEIAELEAIETKSRTREQKTRLTELKNEMKIIDAKAKLKEIRKSNAKAKKDAIITCLDKAGIKTENEAKALIAIRDTLKRNCIDNIAKLQKVIETAKSVAPELFQA